MGDDLISGNGHDEGLFEEQRLPRQRRPRIPIPADESRSDKFVRLAIKRMSKFKATVRAVTKLASYPHTEQQRDRILDEAQKALDELEAAFNRKTRDDSFHF
jgi:acetylornithine deacetylase/succinyl-diaminopimelate desuccinylase-like protein